MQRVNNIYEQIYAMDNIKLAHKNARKGKTHYKEVEEVDIHESYYLLEIQKMLKNKTFVNSEYTVFTKKCSDKERTIYKLPYYPDRIVHHCIMQIMSPIWDKLFITNTYSSIKGRGVHACVDRLKKDLKNGEDCKYCLKLDVKKFYPSIDHTILKDIIQRKVKDKNMLRLLDTIIDSAAGVPIGNYLSQYFGNLYLTYFDHYVKEVLKCRYYYRYCDDVVIVSNSKPFLHSAFDKIKNYLLAKLKLVIKYNWQIFPLAQRGIDFLGYVFHNNNTLLRKTIKERFKTKLTTILSSVLNPTVVLSRMYSYFGWFKYADCHNFKKRYLVDTIWDFLFGQRRLIRQEI